MYRLTVDEFLFMISDGLKNPITMDDVFSKFIHINHLKRIDKIFDKGLHYYLDPKAPEASKEASVFFRKPHFATDELSIGAIKVVNKFEELKLSLSAIAKLSDLEIKRILPKYSINDNPSDIASNIREILYPSFEKDRRDFLKSIITKFAEHNILVFEFIETWNKKEKANIDGVYLKPNLIVLKRHQTFTREIFTIAHELAHYLLEEEEIEQLNYQMIAKSTNRIERWCNDFAFKFLIGNYSNTLLQFDDPNPDNDFYLDHMTDISNKTHLSREALYTRLLYKDQMSEDNYIKIRNHFDEEFRKRKLAKELEKQALKEQGIKQKGSAAKPINSPLFISTIQTAYFEGVLNEFEVCKKLNIKPNNLDMYLQ